MFISTITCLGHKYEYSVDVIKIHYPLILAHDAHATFHNLLGYHSSYITFLLASCCRSSHSLLLTRRFPTMEKDSTLALALASKD